MNWSKIKWRNTTSEIQTDINNIWLKHVCRQKKNDDTKDKDEKEHQEMTGKNGCLQQQEITTAVMMIPALM